MIMIHMLDYLVVYILQIILPVLLDFYQEYFLKMNHIQIII